MAEGFGEIVKGIDEAIAGISEIQAGVNAGTKKATKTAQTAAKRTIKSGMNGAPRWGQRGASGRNKTIEAVNIGRKPKHVPRGGGIGKLTGTLRGNVGGMKRPKLVGMTWHGGVGVGGIRKNITNLYRFRSEGKFPFMRPGVKKAEPKIRLAYETAWAKATAPGTRK